jgi:ABC-type Co2+ transport system permease subunit
VQADFILPGALSAALVVLSGALYALLLALGKLKRSQSLLRSAFAAYAVLFVSALVLARALGLDGYWAVVVIAMLVGYLLAPLAIWHLCVGTHLEGQSAPSARK